MEKKPNELEDVLRDLEGYLEATRLLRMNQEMRPLSTDQTTVLDRMRVKRIVTTL